MRWKSCSKTMAVFAALTAALVLVPCARASGKEKVLYSFKGGNDGTTPVAALVADNAGNLYGVTVSGGAYGDGTVFELARSGRGWRESVLHTFGGTGDGRGPYGGLVLDGAGDLYGTTESGGIVTGGCSPNGCGTVFKLTHLPGGGWRETLLHKFNWNKGDGAQPVAGVIFDKMGNVYGTTISGGTGSCNGGCGTVFKVAPTKTGSWSEDVLYSFNDTDGKYAESSLIFDADGNCYGTTAFGGEYGNGVAFELTPSGGSWTETVLHSFYGSPSDGAFPDGGLVFDKAGKLYGATESGGGYSCGCCGCGIVFALAKGSDGQWSEAILHDFSGGKDGRYPDSPLLLDGAGSLYGGASGDNTQAGDVFEISPSGASWGIRVLYTFTGGKDGRFPGSVIGRGAELFGTASLGGDPRCGGGNGCGVVFEIEK
jgi:uncharacterized repeat protein (TIGR03803 family)